MSNYAMAVLDGIKRKTLVMRGEALRKPLADEDVKRAIGQAISKALDAAHLTKQDVSFEMGYPDQSAISRWIVGVENPQLHRLFLVKKLRGPLVIALAELAEGVEVVTQLTIRRRA